MKKVWWYGYGAAFARQMQGFMDFEFARGWGTRLRGAVRAVSVVVRKKV
jgi:hypothetical protein